MNLPGLSADLRGLAQEADAAVAWRRRRSLHRFGGRERAWTHRTAHHAHAAGDQSESKRGALAWKGRCRLWGDACALWATLGGQPSIAHASMVSQHFKLAAWVVQADVAVGLVFGFGG